MNKPIHRCFYHKRKFKQSWYHSFECDSGCNYDLNDLNNKIYKFSFILEEGIYFVLNSTNIMLIYNFEPKNNLILNLEEDQLKLIYKGHKNMIQSLLDKFKLLNLLN